MTPFLQIRAWQLLAFLFLLGLLIRLPTLFVPFSVVFDEVHFGKFIQAYCCTGEYFFDIHPPHAKLLIAAALGAFSTGQVFAFETIGQSFPEGFPVFALRFFPVLCGALLSLVVFGLVRRCGGSSAIAFFAAWAILFDTAIWVQTRFVFLDGMLWLAGLAAVWLALGAAPLFTQTAPEGKRTWLLVGSGAFLGLAVGTKFTGLAYLALVGAVLARYWLGKLLSERPFNRKILIRALLRAFGEGALVLLGFIVVYLCGWYLHFLLLPNPGAGYAFGQPSGQFFADLVRLHQTMLSANITLATPHHDASPWWGWPVMHTPIFYWLKDEAVIYLIGNPVVWLGSLLLVVFAIELGVLQRLTRLRLPQWPVYGHAQASSAPPDNPLGFTASTAMASAYAPQQAPIRTPVLWLSAAGFLMCYLPLTLVARGLFLYHYIPALLFLIVLAALWLERVGFTDPFKPVLSQGRAYFFVLGLLLLGFLVMLPLSLGTSALQEFRAAFFSLLPGWR